MYAFASTWEPPWIELGGREARVDAGASDAELAAAARRDPAAFEALYRRHLPAVYRYVCFRVGSTVEAEDITSGIFLDALASLPSYREQGRFTAWLYTIAQRHVGAHWRKTRRHAANRADLDDGAIERLADGGDSRRQGRIEAADVLAPAVAGLSGEQREALALRYYGGLKVAEIAVVMDKGESAVKMLLHRALHQLRDTLAPKATDG